MTGHGTGTRLSNNIHGGDDDNAIQTVIHKLKSLFHSVIIRDNVTSMCTTAEADYDFNPTEHLRSIMISDYDSLHVFEYRQCVRIMEELGRLLACCGQNDWNCDLSVPSGLSARIARDVLRMSQNEPCGIRGCELFINLQDKSMCRKMGVINCDPTTVATFELYLTLKVDRRPSAIVRSMLISLKGRVVRGNSNLTKVLRRDYQLTKRKLHRPN